MAKPQNKIVVDAMGSDFAPKSEVEGGLLAIKECNEKAIPLNIFFVGQKDKIQSVIDNFKIDNKTELLKQVEIIDATEVITMHDDPVASLKTKKNSSMIKGLQLHQEGKANGYVSAGNTGATLTLATIILGRIEGVSRPTIGAFLPTSKEKPVFVMDVGATLECKARFLYEYAVMGSVLCKAINGTKNPSVGLLNVGEEPSKGTAELIEAYNKLKTSQGINFYGNVEGNDILSLKTDIVVSDGYVGNVVLKFAESIAVLFNDVASNYLIKNPDKKEQVELLHTILNGITSGLNAEEVGGVPLLGVNGNVIVGHGCSTAKAIKNMIMAVCTIIEENLCGKIKEGLEKVI